MLNTIDTIVATATPTGRGGIAVVRVSGPLVQTISQTLLKKNLSPRHATLSYFFDDQDQIIDEGIAILFSTPHSFTGEDVLELQGHGGPIVVDSLVRYIIQLGARLAKPGEFSERAFLNNKLDLTQAEAIADLINASSEQAARSAMRSLQGEFSKKIQSLVNTLIQLRMYIEAAFDFADEEINFINEKEINVHLIQLLSELTHIQKEATQGSILREGIQMVIAGVPNVGKSSLINALSGKDIAIVTDIPGTTRDILREYISIDGIPLHIIDTAGLRESTDYVEQEGIKRARAEIERADFILFVIDANDAIPNISILNMTEARVIYIRNKIDLIQENPDISIQNGKTIISLSAKRNQGIDLLKNHIKSVLGLQTMNEGIFSARRRHLDALKRAEIFLLSSQEQLKNHASELLAEDLRQTQLALNEITGEFTPDDLLGKIFSSFCIGK
jgi:tRNA modification GTPase